MDNWLPVRINGYKSVKTLFLANDQKRMRIEYEGRTLTIIGVRYPNDGQVQGRNTIVNFDCIETPQPVGVQDAP
jgi:hypothetical protein